MHSSDVLDTSFVFSFNPCNNPEIDLTTTIYYQETNWVILTQLISEEPIDWTHMDFPKANEVLIILFCASLILNFLMKCDV